jgi:sec-independent protein translocase protein TatA
MFGFGTQEVLIIALIILLFFGGKKFPEMMQGLGRGVKTFRDGMNATTTQPQNEENSDSKQS